MLGLRIFLASELEKSRCRNETPVAVGETSSFRPKIEDLSALGSQRRKAEIHRDQLDIIAGSTHDRRHVVDPDIVAFGKLKLALLRGDAKLQGLHHLAVFH